MPVSSTLLPVPSCAVSSVDWLCWCRCRLLSRRWRSWSTTFEWITRSRAPRRKPMNSKGPLTRIRSTPARLSICWISFVNKIFSVSDGDCKLWNTPLLVWTASLVNLLIRDNSLLNLCYWHGCPPSIVPCIIPSLCSPLLTHGQSPLSTSASSPPPSPLFPLLSSSPSVYQ